MTTQQRRSLVRFVPLCVALTLLGCGASARRPVHAQITERLGHELAAGSVLDAAAVAARLRQPIDAESAAALALLANPELRVSLLELDVAEAAVREASTPGNPEVESELQFPLEAEADDAMLFEIEAGLVVSDLWHVPLRRAVAVAELDAGQVAVAVEALDLALRARLALYEVVAAQQALELTRALLVAERLGAALDGASGATLERAAAIERARLAVGELELELLERREALALLLGLDDTAQPLETIARLPEPPAVAALSVEAVERQALSASLAHVELERRAAVLEAEERLALAEAIAPEVTAGVAAEFEGDEVELGPSLGLELPIFDQNLAAFDALEARAAQLAVTSGALTHHVRAAARAAHARLLAASQTLALHRQLEGPLRSLRAARALAQLGDGGVAGLVEGRVEALEGALDEVDALHDTLVARATLDALLAGLLVELP